MDRESFEVQRVSDRIILVKLIVGQRVVTFLSVYAPQSGLSDEVKDLFFDQLRTVTARIPASEFLIPCGDWNGHVGRAGIGYREVHGGMGYGRLEPDVEGERILEYALAFDLLLGGGMNTWKRPLLPSGQLSRPGRLVKALGHHTMQPNKMPDMQCTMLVKKPTRRSTRILTPSLQKSTALLTSLEERTLMLLVTNL